MATMATAITTTMTAIVMARTDTLTISTKAGTRARFTGNGAPAIGPTERRR